MIFAFFCDESVMETFYKEVYNMQKKICNIKELSIYIQTSIPQIRKLVKEKKIPYFRVGNRIKFDMNEVDKWIEKLQENESKISLFI